MVIKAALPEEISPTHITPLVFDRRCLWSQKLAFVALFNPQRARDRA